MQLKTTLSIALLLLITFAAVKPYADAAKEFADDVHAVRTWVEAENKEWKQLGADAVKAVSEFRLRFRGSEAGAGDDSAVGEAVH